jgi:hypothetical protein
LERLLSATALRENLEAQQWRRHSKRSSELRFAIVECVRCPSVDPNVPETVDSNDSKT